MKRLLITLALALGLVGPSYAANLVPPSLTAATSLNNTDLMVVWPTSLGGPLEAIQWSVVKSQMLSALAGQYLIPSNNLSDVTIPATALSNIGGVSASFVSSTYAPLANPAFTGSPTINGVAPVITTDARFSALPQNSKSAAYGFVASDCGGQVYHPSADTTARTWTLPANGTLALPISCKIDVVNDCSAGALTIAITTDTMVWFTAGTTGSRTLQACGEATLTKVSATRWAIVGAGVS